MSERFLSFDSRERSVTESIIFFIDVILAKVSILGIDKLKGVDIHSGNILTEGLGWHFIFRT